MSFNFMDVAPSEVILEPLKIKSLTIFTICLSTCHEEMELVFFGRTDAKVEIPILWPPHAKS